MITKVEIGKVFRELEKIPPQEGEKYTVLNFGIRWKGSPAAKGMPDIMIIFSGFLHFIEIKTKGTKDRLSKSQKEVGVELKKVDKDNKKVFYHVANEENYLKIRDSIILMESGVK